MDRKNNVGIAAGLSMALVVAGSGFAFANGVFGAGSSDRVGSFPAMMARLTPQTAPAATTTTAAGAAPPHGTEESETVARGTLAGRFEPGSTTATTTMPDRSDDRPEPGDDPTTVAPPVVTTPTSTTVAHSGPSPVTEHESDDDAATGTGTASDD